MFSWRARGVVVRTYAKLIKQTVAPKFVKPELDRPENFNSFVKLTDAKRKIILENEQKIQPVELAPSLDKEGSERLTKYLARIGMCSRRQADELITQGAIRINGEVAEVGARIVPSDSVVINGVEMNTEKLQESANTPKMYAFNKPRGMLCSRIESDPNKDRPTVHGVLSKLGLGHLIPIGRLDFNSEGLLLLTNDGALAKYMMHPRTAMQREYLVKVSGNVTQAHLDKFKRGSNVMGEHFGRIEATIFKEKKNCTWLRVHLYEGKNREIRKVFQQFGMFVNILKRVKYGPFSLSNVQKSSLKRVLISDELLKHCNQKFVGVENNNFEDDD